TAATPPLAAAGVTSASYAPAALTDGTTYFWSIIARNDAGSTQGPLWSFTTAAVETPPPTDVVIYADDLPATALHGSWQKASDPTSPSGINLVTAESGWSSLNRPVASPTDYVDVEFNADAGIDYTLWLRLK